MNRQGLPSGSAGGMGAVNRKFTESVPGVLPFFFFASFFFLARHIKSRQYLTAPYKTSYSGNPIDADIAHHLYDTLIFVDTGSRMYNNSYFIAFLRQFPCFSTVDLNILVVLFEYE